MFMYLIGQETILYGPLTFNNRTYQSEKNLRARRNPATRNKTLDLCQFQNLARLPVFNRSNTTVSLKSLLTTTTP